jgi:hypothetical protein
MPVPKQAGRRGRPFRRVRAAVLAASDVCWLCGHGGSDSVDHVIPRAVCIAMEWLHLLNDPSNLRPAHHLPCGTCGVRCNRQRGTGMAKRKPGAKSRDW